MNTYYFVLELFNINYFEKFIKISSVITTLFDFKIYAKIVS